MNNLEYYLNQIPEFEERLKKFLSELEELGLKNMEKLTIDHICIQLLEDDQAQALLDEILNLGGKILSNAEFKGRMIYSIKLSTSIKVLDQKVDVLELPFPEAEKGLPNDMWEHVEFIIPGNANTLEELEANIFEHFGIENLTELEQKLNKVSKSMPVGKATDKPNPVIKLEREKGTEIKLHARSLEDVVSN